MAVAPDLVEPLGRPVARSDEDLDALLAQEYGL
jgi:hypothetical protein